MSCSAIDLLDPVVGGSFAHGDAVVAGLYSGVDHGHVARFLDVDAVGVGAVAGAVMVAPCFWMLLLPKTAMWKSSLLREVRPLITTFLDSAIVNDCIHIKTPLDLPTAIKDN